MPRLTRRLSSNVGLPPGTLIYTGEKRTEKVKISLIDYDEKHYKELEVDKIDDCTPFKDKPTVTWINIDGIHHVNLIEQIGKCFDLHPLVMEDIITSDQRPKIEDYEDRVFSHNYIAYCQLMTDISETIIQGSDL